MGRNTICAHVDSLTRLLLCISHVLSWVAIALLAACGGGGGDGAGSGTAAGGLPPPPIQTVDSAAATDPFFDYGGGLRNDSALQPALMRDAARLAPLGESLVVVLRTGRNAVVAYRLDPNASGVYSRTWRTLVEPGTSILGRGIFEGSFDVFGQLENHLRLFVDADATGMLAIGVVDRSFFNFAFQAHTEQFGEVIAAATGILLTRVAGADGQRLGTTVIDTHQLAELHALRATPGGFVLVGRVRSDAADWNAFTASVGRDGAAGPYSVIDVDHGDVSAL